MTKVQAYAAHEKGGKLELWEYELGELDAFDVDISVEHCGVCHSDLSMLDNEWMMSEYPFVGGHEVIGKVKAIGSQVKNLQVGDSVGLGWHSDYCMNCQQCLTGNQNMCNDAMSTIVGRYGGFADTVRANVASVIKLPEGINKDNAGPLFCAGITVFNPLVQYNISPTASVAVIGIGGLGHLALQFARAWGCHVTAFTSTDSKRDEALNLGAYDTINSRDSQAIADAADRFDLILSTVSVKLDWNAYLETLKPLGRLHSLGVIPEPLDLNITPLLFKQRSVSSSPVGSPATIAQMLEFCSRHKIEPVTEHFPLSKINDAFDHLRSGNARYRIVLDRD